MSAPLNEKLFTALPVFTTTIVRYTSIAITRNINQLINPRSASSVCVITKSLNKRANVMSVAKKWREINYVRGNIFEFEL